MKHKIIIIGLICFGLGILFNGLVPGYAIKLVEREMELVGFVTGTIFGFIFGVLCFWVWLE